MPGSEDFSPIVEEAQLDASGGLLSRLRRRQEVTPLSAGFERVLLDEDGSPPPGGQLSAGQKYWSRARSWAKVDVGLHNLSFDIRFSDPTGTAGFVAKLAVATKVENAAGAVSSGATSVKEFLEPALSQAISEVRLEAHPGDGEDPAAALTAMAAEANTALGKALKGDVPGLPDWLSAQCSSVVVNLDAETAKHRDELVGRARGGQLLKADGANKQIERVQEMDMRDFVRERLAPHFTDPVARIFELVAADPSQQNIEKAVGAVSGMENEHRAAVLSVLEDAINNDLLDVEDPMYQAMVEMVVKALKGASLAAAPAAALGTAPAGLSPSPEGETVEGEHETEEVDSPGADSDGEGGGDRDWTSS